MFRGSPPTPGRPPPEIRTSVEYFLMAVAAAKVHYKIMCYIISHIIRTPRNESFVYPFDHLSSQKTEQRSLVREGGGLGIRFNVKTLLEHSVLTVAWRGVRTFC